MKVVVVASGELAASDAEQLDGADLVVAADGGAASLDRLGLRPELLIGDMDSVDAALVDRLASAGTRVVRHAADKDASDLELAVRAAVEAGATELVVLGAVGGERLDHALANLLLLAGRDLAGCDARAVHGVTRVRAIHAGARLVLGGAVGDLVTLLPIGFADGVTTAGLRWPLDAATLPAGSSRGLSNVIERHPASVQLDGGALLVVETATKGLPR